MKPHTSPTIGALRHVMLIFKLISLLMFALVASSCTVNPFTATRPDGLQIASLGGSFFTKAKAESGEIVKADGTRLAYTRTGKNETTGITTSVAAYAAGQVAQAWADSRAGVENAKTAAELAKAQDASAAAVKQAQIAAEIEKAKLVPVPAAP